MHLTEFLLHAEDKDNVVKFEIINNGIETFTSRCMNGSMLWIIIYARSSLEGSILGAVNQHGQ